MKKTVPSIGIIIFGILFVLAGLHQLRSGVAVIMTKKVIAPIVYDAGIQRVNELENFIGQKTLGNEQDRKQSIYAGVNQIKSVLENYKAHYVDKKDFSWVTKIFLIACVLSAGLFLYSGIALLQLRTNASSCVAYSLAMGIIVSFIFLWDIFIDVAFVLRLSEEVSRIFSLAQGNTPPPASSNLELAQSILTPVAGMMLSFYFSCYALFTSLTALYFRRPKVKAQFNDPVTAGS